MTKNTLIDFPCSFPIKIIGINSGEFIDEIVKVTKKHFPDFNRENLSEKVSQNASYLAVTVTVIADNQSMLDAYYQDIVKITGIKMVL